MYPLRAALVGLGSGAILAVGAYLVLWAWNLLYDPVPAMGGQPFALLILTFAGLSAFVLSSYAFEAEHALPFGNLNRSRFVAMPAG